MNAGARRKWIVGAAAAIVFTAGVTVLMLWLVGAFRPKIAAQDHAGPALRPIGSGRLVDVVAATLPREETAVGSVQPVHRVEVASRLLARVVEVNAAAGRAVAKGDVLVRLEDSDLKARLAQARAAVAQAGAALEQARAEESRIRTAAAAGAVAAVELDRAVSGLKAAQAALTRTEQAQAEAETLLEYATIRSPIDGAVIDKRIDLGDTVSPGQVVAALLDPKRMQLVASVRESLSRRLTVGGAVSVKIDILDHPCSGTVSEIVPEAEGVSRTFQVKVVGPCPEGVFTGMFGRLIIPVGEETVTLIPREAVRTVGQIDCVDVASGEARIRRAVRLGRAFDGRIEVLAGLAVGEKVVVDAGGPR